LKSRLDLVQYLYSVRVVLDVKKQLTRVPEKLWGNGVPGSTQIALIPTDSTFPCTPICPTKQQRYPVYPSEAAPSVLVVFQRFQLLSAQTGAVWREGWHASARPFCQLWCIEETVRIGLTHTLGSTPRHCLKIRISRRSRNLDNTKQPRIERYHLDMLLPADSILLFSG